MPLFLKNIIEILLWTPPGMKGKHARFYLFHRYGPWVACWSHGSWVVVFALNGVDFMAYYNIVVTILFAIYGLLWPRMQGPMWYIHFLYFIEIPFHALLGTLYTGPLTVFWLFGLVPALACLLTPQFSRWLQSGICLFLVAWTTAIGIVGILQPAWTPLSNPWVIFLFATNLFSVSMAFIFYLGLNQYLVETAEEGLEREFQRAENLLRNILPDPIALRLKDGEQVIANEHREVSVIFADIVGFTEASSKLSPADLVETLDLVFSEFDMLADRHGAEKIKTIGDAYMAVVGVPEETGSHADVAVSLANDMLKATEALSSKTHFKVQLRIGVNSGPVVAGVIGKRKFAYDLWGDAVNMASRMESQGAPGQIIVSDATAKLLSDRYAVKPEGTREIKGKGATPVFSVTANA